MTKTKKTKPQNRPMVQFSVCLLLLTGFLCFFSARWFVGTYGRLGFDSILFTLSAQLEGVQAGLLFQYLLKAVIPAFALTALTDWLLTRPAKRGKFQKVRSRHPILLAVLIACVLIGFARPIPRASGYRCSTREGARLNQTLNIQRYHR